MIVSFLEVLAAMALAQILELTENTVVLSGRIFGLFAW
jgi:hypothetical protein